MKNLTEKEKNDIALEVLNKNNFSVAVLWCATTLGRTAIEANAETLKMECESVFYDKKYKVRIKIETEEI